MYSVLVQVPRSVSMAKVFAFSFSRVPMQTQGHDLGDHYDTKPKVVRLGVWGRATISCRDTAQIIRIYLALKSSTSRESLRLTSLALVMSVRSLTFQPNPCLTLQTIFHIVPSYMLEIRITRRRYPILIRMKECRMLLVWWVGRFIRVTL